MLRNRMMSGFARGGQVCDENRHRDGASQDDLGEKTVSDRVTTTSARTPP
jgi:hypothetical protein